MRKYFYLLIIVISCGGNLRKEENTIASKKVESYLSIQGISEDTICGVGVTLVQEFMDSADTAGTILILPGWDFERHRWLNETNIKAQAKKHRYRLILPEMRRSIYASHFYPETSAEARHEKTGTWLTDTLIPAIQKRYKVLLPGARNFVMGLSTGGRGAVYCAWKLPGIFKAAASLSGDFDQTQMPTDNLMTSVYGHYESNKDRWKKDDNLYNIADSIKQPIYLAHGDADKVVPFNQSTAFYTQIKKANGKVKIHFVNGAGHDFKFWGNEVIPVLQFFDKIK